MNLPTLSSSPIAVPAVSCFFETLHEPTCVEQMEPVLDQLTMDQIVQVEQMIRKIKKRKARALADDGVNKKHKVEQGIKSSPPVVELRDGIEWVSFVYSHNRVLQRHAIRTDIDTLTVDDIDTSFQLDNCVYPRANVPQEKYQGNRWDYETQCNVLGWKLAWMNPDLVGKRGLIQRAVDSYRNRTPTMRSRRAARQTKMLNGTLRKRTCSSVNNHCLPCIPKTITMEDEHHVRFRIKIHLDTIDLDTIDTCFRLANCVYPRAMVSPDMSSQKWMEENLCNELGWKMAWLNPKLVNKRNLLQRALDLYRLKFMPGFSPRQHSSRTPPTDINLPQQPISPSLSCTTGTTESLDFDDCFSIKDDDDRMDLASIDTGNSESTIFTPTLSPLLPTSLDHLFDDTSLDSFITQDLPSSAAMDLSKSYDHQCVFGHDSLLKMESTVDDLFHFD